VSAQAGISYIVVSCESQLPQGVRGSWRGNTIWLCKTLNQAARKLIPLPELLHGLQRSTNDDELAETLWTDVHTVGVRRQTLTRMEIAWLDEPRRRDMGLVEPRLPAHQGTRPQLEYTSGLHRR
jgi:hypothetical protein